MILPRLHYQELIHTFLSSTSVILQRLHYQGLIHTFYHILYMYIFIIFRSPGGTPLVNRKKKLRKGTGLAPIMATALKKKFIVSKISYIYKQQGDFLLINLFKFYIKFVSLIYTFFLWSYWGIFSDWLGWWKLSVCMTSNTLWRYRLKQWR